MCLTARAIGQRSLSDGTAISEKRNTYRTLTGRFSAICNIINGKILADTFNILSYSLRIEIFIFILYIVSLYVTDPHVNILLRKCLIQ